MDAAAGKDETAVEGGLAAGNSGREAIWMLLRGMMRLRRSKP
jgi:hypothetical protein